MAACLPVLFLAVGAAVARLAAAALLGGQRWQCDSADWALREDHCALFGAAFGAAPCVKAQDRHWTLEIGGPGGRLIGDWRLVRED